MIDQVGDAAGETDERDSSSLSLGSEDQQDTKPIQPAARPFRCPASSVSLADSCHAVGAVNESGISDIQLLEINQQKPLFGPALPIPDTDP